MNSVAETELLTQLAALLMPEDVAIEEMFRNFPAPEGWGGNYLEPDLSLFGVLKDENAALFVEYDGSWRHETKEGMERDQMKNAALLKYASAGSYIIRISHTISKPLEGNALWVKIDTWRRGDVKTLSEVLMDLLVRIKSSGLQELLHPRVANRVSVHMERDSIKLSAHAHQLACSAVVVGGGNTSEEISSFLSSEGFGLQNATLAQAQSCCGVSIERTLQPKMNWLLGLGLTKSQAAKAVSTHPQILGLSIEHNLKPTVQWFLGLGLTKNQVAKAVATSPRILGYSIEQNLKPTVQWLLGLGLTTSQVGKAVATFPPILGYSIEQNLTPTVQWLLGLGLTKSQAAKAVSTHPQILGLSIEQNLKPTVQWLLNLGLTKSQVAKSVFTAPPILKLSIEQNLKPTVQWFLGLGLTKNQVAKAVATSPPILWCSIEQNLKPTVQWFLGLGLTKNQVAKAVATSPCILGYSIEQNLKPTVQWLLGLGLTSSQVALTVARFPTILGYSIELNLKPTVQWLQGFHVSKKKLRKVIANWPRLLGYSVESNLEPKARLLEEFCSQQQASEIIASNPEILRFSYRRIAARFSILSKQNKQSQAYYAMRLTDDVFERRIPRKFAKTIGIAVDHRRRNRCTESLQANVERLKLYMSKLLLFPKKSGVKGVKKGDTPRSELQNVAQNTLKEIIPVPKVTKRIKARAITSEEKEQSAYKTLKKARTAAHYQGERIKKAKEAAAKET
ncbi:unnamed protein product [Cladocopium goreaui]|uniref:Transcription termination factor MTERF2, chloroplastic (Mitochondrial transcription termination factor 2) (Protein EMBRYO DEFECTIVE 2219) n=1 Tax=Cladocopium goreaui TaxID=2562237 RepID=A0A9P1BHI1_9DINO|nr:unnamed protein product [Cladocopium goreaui]